MTKENELLELLAAHEHRHWVLFSKDVAETGMTAARLDRWEKHWVPYENLDEGTKEIHRYWAREILNIIPENKLLRPELARFAGRMEAVLKENDHRGGWQTKSTEELQDHIARHIENVDYCLNKWYKGKVPPDLVVDELVDVANYCMMLADTLRPQTKEASTDEQRISGGDR